MAKNQARPINKKHIVPNGTDNKYSYLINAEMSAESNYNMVGDGTINNVPKPSLLECLEEYEKQKRECQKEELADDSQERHKSDYLESVDER